MAASLSLMLYAARSNFGLPETIGGATARKAGAGGALRSTSLPACVRAFLCHEFRATAMTKELRT